MRLWKKNLYPRATLNEQALYEEITGEKGKCPYNVQDWQDTIIQAWKWIDSPTGTQGLVYKTYRTKRNTLKGSKTYANTTTQIALKLFTFFAQDWEDKNNLLPPHARKHPGTSKGDKLTCSDDVPNAAMPNRDPRLRK